MIRKTRDSDDMDHMGNVPAKVGTSFLEQLMAEPNHVSSETFNEELNTTVTNAIAQLSQEDKFIIEASYIWGRSYAEIADMMGYSSKSTVHKLMHKAQENLRDILILEPTIIKLLKGNTEDDME
jgi:RNA polymerase sigma factor (sigma-70 family)